MSATVVKRGTSAPLGATLRPGGVNFSVFSKAATRMELLLFDDEKGARPARVIPLDRTRHRTYHYWHVFVPELGPGQIYAYRAQGPFAPHRGQRFDGEKVLLDVVFNHTTEGGEHGPTLSFRGLANDFYYILEEDKARYADFSGYGNTLNANQPIVRGLIQDSLRYWVTEMHVDGFRFDLASILSRDEKAGLSLNELLARAHIEWHGVALGRPDWREGSHSLAFTLRSLRGRFLMHGMFNAYWEPLVFELPSVQPETGEPWRRCLDTALAPPHDVCAWAKGLIVEQERYVVQPRAIAVLARSLPGAREGRSGAKQG